MDRVIAEVYMLVNKDPEKGIIFRAETSPKGLWDVIEDEEFMGTGCRREDLRMQGWRAKKVKIVLEE